MRKIVFLWIALIAYPHADSTGSSQSASFG